MHFYMFPDKTTLFGLDVMLNAFSPLFTPQSSNIPDWAGQPNVDPLEEEENEVEVMVSGKDSHLADESSKDASKDSSANQQHKTPKKFYYKAPEFELAEGVSSLESSQLILATCPASSAFLFHSIAGALKSSGATTGLSLVARVVYTPRGYSKCSYDLYGLVEGSSSSLVPPSDPSELVSPFPAGSVASGPYPLLIGVTHVAITTQFAAPLAVALLSRLPGRASVFASLPHTTYTHAPVVTFSHKLDAPANAKNDRLGPNPYACASPPLLYGMATAPTATALRLPLLPPPNMLYGLDAALLTHARVHRRPLTAFVSVDHQHHFPGESLQAWEPALDAVLAQAIGADAPAHRAKALPKGELARARVYAAWRGAWRRAPVSLAHRDLGAHRLALMTDKSIPHGIFA
jgi:hypothetical protein